MRPPYFSVLGVRAAHGRLLSPDDWSQHNGRAAVLRYGFWRDRFASETSLVGKTVILNGQPFLVVGIAAPGFVGTDVAARADVWLPLASADIIQQRPDWRSIDAHWLRLVGRLQPETSMEAAQVNAARAYARFAEELRQSRQGGQRAQLERGSKLERVQLKPVSAVSPDARDAYIEQFSPLLGAVGLVLLLCCANVANLLLGRGFQRSHELSIRQATGASRWRLVRQLLAEGLLLALSATLLGIGFAVASSRYLHYRIGFAGAPALDLSPDLTTVFFTVGVSALCVLLATLFPALTASRVPLISALKGGTITTGKHRVTLGSRGWLITAQFALCLPLLVGAGLLIQTVDNLFSQDVGFERAQRFHATLALARSGYVDDGALTVLNDLLAALQAQNGFTDVGYSMFGTLGSSYATTNLEVSQPEGGGMRITANWSYVSEGYLETLGIPLLAGRDIRRSDDDSAPNVAIVNQAFARGYFGVENPVGRRIENVKVPITIVGLIADSRHHNLRVAATPQILYPYRQSTHGFPIMQIYVRSLTGVESFSKTIREHVRRVGPHLRVDGIESLDDVIGNRIREERTTSVLLTGFGLLALFVTALGLYSVISFDVVRRTQEVGLRIALGARRSDIYSMVFRRAAPWVVIGAGLGIAGAAAVTRLLESKLFGISTLDVKTFVAAAVFLLACAAAANYIPSRRAAGVEPMAALRQE